MAELFSKPDDWRRAEIDGEWWVVVQATGGPLSVIPPLVVVPTKKLAEQEVKYFGAKRYFKIKEGRDEKDT